MNEIPDVGSGRGTRKFSSIFAILDSRIRLLSSSHLRAKLVKSEQSEGRSIDICPTTDI